MKSATLTALLNKFIPIKSDPDTEYDDSVMLMALSDPKIRAANIRCALAVGILVDKTTDLVQITGLVQTMVRDEMVQTTVLDKTWIQWTASSIHRRYDSTCK